MGEFKNLDFENFKKLPEKTQKIKHSNDIFDLVNLFNCSDTEPDIIFDISVAVRNDTHIQQQR